MADEASTSASASRRPTTDTYEGLSLSWPQLEFHFVGRGMIRPTGRLFIPFVRPFKNRRSFKDPGQTLARHSTHCIQTGILPGAFSPRVCLYRARQCTQTSLERKQTWRGNARRIDFWLSQGDVRFPSCKLGNIIGIIRDSFRYDRSRMICENSWRLGRD